MKFLFLAIFLLSSKLFAEPVSGRVVFLGKTAKSPYAVVDAGVNKGFTVGKTICFFDAENTELFCQKIIKARAKAASVRLTPQQLDLLTLEIRAFLEGEAPSKDEFESDQEPEEKRAEADHDTQKIVDESEPEVALPPSRLKLSYVYTLISPVSYSVTKFDVSQVGNTSGNVWASGTAVRSSLLGFQFLWQKFFKPTWTWGLGVGYSFFPKQKSSYDYDPTNANSSILTSVVGHLYSLNIPVTKHMEISPGLNLEVGPGLSLLRSQVKHAGQVTTTAATSDVASVTSTIHVAAVTGDVGIAKAFGAWTISGEAKVLVPVMEFMKSTAGESTASGSGADAGIDSLSSALAHKKNAFGAQILLSVGRVL